jgi:DNA-binding transcriptional MerR regulator
MRIGEAAARAGVNVETLRYYERRGLLGAPARTPHGYRAYDEETVRFVRAIKDAQSLGFSLAEIEDYLRLAATPHASSDALRARIAAKIDDVDEKIASLRRMRTGLARALDCSCDSLDRCTCGAGQLARRGREPRSAGALHVTNGDSAGNTLRRTGLDGLVLAWRDMLPEGPLLPLPVGELREVRARFLADCGWGEPAVLAAEMAERDRVLDAAPTVALWFEQDVLDQLQLLQVLVRSAGKDAELVLLDDPAYRGLGELQPEQLAALWPLRVPVSTEVRELAARAWDAVCAPAPTAIAESIAGDTRALPLLAPALARWLEELPDTEAGLGLSERRILTALAERPRTPHELFLGSMEGERLLMNGDTWFFRHLAELGPLVETGTRYRLTDLGRRVLAGDEDRVEVVGLDRWLGGTHLTPANAWRRGPDGRLVAP